MTTPKIVSAVTLALLATAVLCGNDGSSSPATIETGGGVAATKSSEARVPARPSTERTLRLPESPYRYADIDLPDHFKTAGAQRFDNTPRNNLVTDHGAT